MKRALFASAALLLLSFAVPAFAQGMTGGCATGQACTNLTALSLSPSTVAYTVGSGGNFTSLSAALTTLQQSVLPIGNFVNLTLLDGVTTEPGPDLVESSFAKQINVQGQHTYSFTMSSVQSSSGSAGAWSYILNLNSVTNIAVGDYLTIYSTSGGTNPTYVQGVWPVTNVDAVNNRVTLTTTGRQAAAASGAVAGTVLDMKSILKFTGTDGIQIWNGAAAINLTNFNIVGDGTAGTNGISLQDGDRVYVNSILSVANFGGSNILSLYPSELNTSGTIVTSSSGGVGIIAQNGIVDSVRIVSSGNASHGVEALVNGSVSYSTEGVFSGNGGDGVLTTVGGALNGTSLIATGNVAHGVNGGLGGLINYGSLTSTNNGVTDQTQFYQNGLLANGQVAFGYTTPQGGAYEVTVNGSGQFNGGSVDLRNTSGTAIYFADSNGSAQAQYRDQTGTAKWEVGHRGSANNYDFQIFDDITSKRSMSIDHSTDYVTFIAPITPGSVAVGGANSCSVAGARAWVTDASVAFGSSTRGGQITGAGANAVPAICDGAHWLYD